MTHAAIILTLVGLAVLVLYLAIWLRNAGGSERGKLDTPVKAHSSPQINESNISEGYDPDDYSDLSAAKFEDLLTPQQKAKLAKVGRG
ncbi:MAG: hypothetical protein DHS20C08_04450 [Rhodomicrobium sp.]|nr:MAG: hypothetical protein DHS20C08_04450 [Rhodomicrobium sp.]